MPDSASTPTGKKRMNRVAKMAIVIVVSAVVLVILLAAAGVTYTFISGSKPVKNAPAPAAVKPRTNLPSARPVVADDAAVGVSVQTITSPVAPGSNSYVAIKTLQTATCTITVEYNKVKATDSGLVEKTADEYGVASWSWTVPADAPLGSWPVTITCAHGQKSAVVTTTLVVAATTDD